MRVSTRIRIGRWNFYASLGRVQTVTGISSKLKNGLHIVMWDFDRAPLNKLERSLKTIQDVFQLGEIQIFGDGKPDSYRAVCYSQVDFLELLKILITTPYVDETYILMTARKGQATVRVGPKINRGKQVIVSIVPGRVEPPPDEVTLWLYETGLDKDVLRLGPILRA